MAVKTCSVEMCGSSSTHEEDIGVTYLKFPKDPSKRELWGSVTRLKVSDQPQPIYVCSRHFREKDFEKQDSKYVLKSDAVPSIFSWNMEEVNKSTDLTNMDIECTERESSELPDKEKTENLDSSKESDVENVDAIKEFIAAQEQEIADAKAVNKKDESILGPSETTQPSDVNIENVQEVKESKDEIPEIQIEKKIDESICEDVSAKENDAMAEAAHVLNMILTETETKMAGNFTTEKKTDKPVNKQIMSSGEKGNTMALSVGSRVEARDFSEDWHPAEILEVDFEEMEVLVHYEVANKKPDEWISVSSPRLRPEGTGPLKGPSPVPDEPEPEPETPQQQIQEEIKHEEKPKLTFEVGERCLARYRDNRRFIATIGSDLGEGVYEIIFDDGARWSCNTSRLYKLKDDSGYPESVPLTMSTPSPGPVPSGSQSAPLTQLPLYHTHLFDPTRDYLGSKSERREKKRKLNIKEIFNIGQKKVKKTETPKTSKPKPPTKPKPNVVKKKLDMRSDFKKEVVVKKEEPTIKEEILSSPIVKKDISPSPVVKKDISSSPIVKKDISSNPIVKKEILSSPIVPKEIPEAIASIIGTPKEESKEASMEIKQEILDVSDTTVVGDTGDVANESLDLTNSETMSAPLSNEMKHEEEETKLEKFEQQDNKQNDEVIDRIKEVIIKLEDGLSEIETKNDIIKNIESPKVVIKEDDIILADLKPTAEDKTKNLAKVKKSKKLRLLQEKKVKKQVEKVKSELEVMKKQMEEMKKAMLLKTEEIAKGKGAVEMPESFLLPGEWCCKWVNGQPVGAVSEMEGDVRVGADNRPALPRRSVQVEDKRLPEGWTKHMVRRSLGNSAGKWDVVLVSPEDRRFHTKTEMRHYFEHNPAIAESLKDYHTALYDFGVHLKLSRRMGWYTTTPDGEQTAPTFTVPAGAPVVASPLYKRERGLTRREKMKLKREKDRGRSRKKPGLSKALLMEAYANYPAVINTEAMAKDLAEAGPSVPPEVPAEPQLDIPPLEPLEDGCVYVGSLKVQIIETLLRCPAEGCFKNFRNSTLLKMHIKHYHRELVKQLGATPKVLDLAYARTRPSHMEMRKLKLEGQRKTLKVKMPRFQKRLPYKSELKDVKLEPKDPSTPIKREVPKIPRSQDSPKLRSALGKHIRRPKVLLPVRRPINEVLAEQMKDEVDQFSPLEPKQEVPMEPLDFETAISTHTVTKPIGHTQKNRQSLPSASKLKSEDEEWMGSDPETRSSYPRSGSPDYKNMDQKLVSPESNEEQKDNNYWYNERGERIKIVHMKREEIINCHCGFREEDGLMVQCELCLCWQHALCHNIQREADVPEKYTCSICLNPRRGRRSQRFLHDQDRLYEGLLPGAKQCDSLRRSHELSGNLIRIQDALHALRVKYLVATKKDHPKLYLWAKDWEPVELSVLQDRLNSDYSDLNIMISSIGKENLPLKDIKDDIKDIHIDPISDDNDFESGQRYSQKDALGSQALLSGLLSSPGRLSLDLPISTFELERLAKTVQEEAARVIVPQPEAAIENSACRERLLRHMQRCQALVDARLDSIEAQVAELESQDPSFEDDETADFFPRTKQTVQMMMRDLETMEELGVIT